MKKKETLRALMMLLLVAAAVLSWKGNARAAGEPEISWIYLDPEGYTEQLLVIAMKDAAPSAASVTYTAGERTETVSAAEIRGKNIAFLVNAGGSLTSTGLSALQLTVGGTSLSVDLRKFRADAGTDSVKVSETEEESGFSSLSMAVAESTAQIGTALSAAAAQTSVRAGSGSDGNIVIVLDPGHGGTDGGASRTWDGVTYQESKITLKIAEYMKAELETYSGVTVYMTRTKDEAVELADRVSFAKKKNATALISLHINSTAETSSTATGAEVLVSKGNYNPSQAVETKAIAEQILDSLEEIGFKNLGLIYRLSESGNTYKNGKLADYYTIVCLSVLAGFPGMIVEHGFVSNKSDCVKYFGSDAKIKKIGVADARAVAAYYGLKKGSDAGADDGGEVTVKKGWVRQDNQVYYYYEDGTCATGLVTIKNRLYYFDSKGVRKTGWKRVDGNVYYFSPTKYNAVKGWQTIKGKTYYFNSSYIRQTGIFQVKGDFYYADPATGIKKTGWVTVDGNRYCFLKADDGRMIIGRYAMIKGVWYYFDSYGVCVS